MISAIVGVIGAALLFGVFAALRPRDRAKDEGCTGNCVGCLRDGGGACEYRETAGAQHDRES